MPRREGCAPEGERVVGLGGTRAWHTLTARRWHGGALRQVAPPAAAGPDPDGRRAAPRPPTRPPRGGHAATGGWRAGRGGRVGRVADAGVVRQVLT